MAMFLRLQNLPDEADNLDIRNFFPELNIPKGGVRIIGGLFNEAFVWFETELDLLKSLKYKGKTILGQPMNLLIGTKEDFLAAQATNQSQVAGFARQSQGSLHDKEKSNNSLSEMPVKKLVKMGESMASVEHDSEGSVKGKDGLEEASLDKGVATGSKPGELKREGTCEDEETAAQILDIFRESPEKTKLDKGKEQNEPTHIRLGSSTTVDTKILIGNPESKTIKGTKLEHITQDKAASSKRPSKSDGGTRTKQQTDKKSNLNVNEKSTKRIKSEDIAACKRKGTTSNYGGKKIAKKAKSTNSSKFDQTTYRKHAHHKQEEEGHNNRHEEVKVDFGMARKQSIIDSVFINHNSRHKAERAKEERERNYKHKNTGKKQSHTSKESSPGISTIARKYKKSSSNLERHSSEKNYDHNDRNLQMRHQRTERHSYYDNSESDDSYSSRSTHSSRSTCSESDSANSGSFYGNSRKHDTQCHSGYVVVHGLQRSVTEKDLREFLMGYAMDGPITLIDDEHDATAHMAYLKFAKQEDAINANRLNKKRLHFRRVSISEITQFRYERMLCNSRVRPCSKELDNSVQHPPVGGVEEFHGRPPAGQFHGQLPVEEFHGRPPAGQFHGQLPVEEFQGGSQAGHFHGPLPGEEFHGRPQAGQFHGQLPVDEFHGWPPAAQFHGQLPVEEFQGWPPSGQFHGQLPVEEFHGWPPAGQFHGWSPAGQFHGWPPAGQFHGRPPAGQFHGRPPAEQQLPAGKLYGELPVQVLIGHRITQIKDVTTTDAHREIILVTPSTGVDDST